MAKFNLDDYVEVNVRIEKFWNDYPDGRIETDIVRWEGDTVVMNAKVYKDKADNFPAATGHAYEVEGSSYINKTSALENCETSAVGRALAIMGYEIKKSVASKEEVVNAKLQQEDVKKRLKKLKTLAQGNKSYQTIIKDAMRERKISKFNNMPDSLVRGLIKTIEKMQGADQQPTGTEGK